MNITFLIGNGFDIGLGLKSKFSDFFPLYIKNNEGLSGLADEIREDQDKWSYFEKQLGEYTVNFSVDTIKDFQKQINDFEIQFMEYLKKEESKLNFSNKDIISKTLLNGLNNFYSQKYIPVSSSSIIRGIYQAYQTENHTINFINFNYTNCLSNTLKPIPDGIISRRNIHGNIWIDKIGKIIHVHGFIDGNPITGVNDATQIKNKELANNQYFVKRFVKPIHNKAIKMNYDKNATDIINNSTIICIYGMSLGETDKKWWSIILDWLQKNDNRQLVVYVYDDKFTKSSQFGWLDKEDELMDKLEEYKPHKDFSVSNVQDRIHLAVHQNIFEMDLTSKKDAVAASTNVSKAKQV